MKDIVKWAVIAVLVLVGWRFLNSAIAGIGGAGSASSSSDEQVPQLGPYYWGPAYYVMGVYGPSSPTDPWYSSPYGPPGTRRNNYDTSVWGN